MTFSKSVKRSLNFDNSNRVVNVIVLAGGSLKGKVHASVPNRIYAVVVSHGPVWEVLSSLNMCSEEITPRVVTMLHGCYLHFSG